MLVGFAVLPASHRACVHRFLRTIIGALLIYSFVYLFVYSEHPHSRETPVDRWTRLFAPKIAIKVLHAANCDARYKVVVMLSDAKQNQITAVLLVAYLAPARSITIDA